MADVILTAEEALRERGAADAQALAARAVTGEAGGTELTARAERVPTWRPRDFSDVAVGTPYKWRGQVYKLWQQHDTAGQEGWSPDQAAGLWDLCHTTDPALAGAYAPPQGSRGLYQAGECCVFGERIWRCMKDNVAYSPAELAEGWELVGAVSEEASGVEA